MSLPPSDPTTLKTSETPVKDAIDTHSGRFEFFKQSLTLGSAGLAGIAALFTDTARIPTDCFSVLAVAITGIALLALLVFSVMGLSVYANLLNAVARDAGLPAPTSQNPQPPMFFVDGVIRWARFVMVSFGVAWLSLLTFAAVKIFTTSATKPETVLAVARSLVVKETGQASNLLLLKRLDNGSDNYTITYDVTGTGTEVTVQISKKDGGVTRIDQIKKGPGP